MPRPPEQNLNRIVLIGCGKAKRDEPAPARELYTGSLFKKRLEYAESTGRTWWILSAKYGLIHPDQEIKPYDLTMKDLAWVDQAAWIVCVLHEILNGLGDTTEKRGLTLEFHAGADYIDDLHDAALAVGFNTWWPVKGLTQGKLMKWYTEATSRNNIFNRNGRETASA